MIDDQADENSGSDIEANDDLVNQKVKRPIRLRGEQEHSDRQRANFDAIGGMRNPRLSNKRVPGHDTIWGSCIQGYIRSGVHVSRDQRAGIQGSGRHDEEAQGSDASPCA